jgi:hypothetical protein
MPILIKGQAEALAVRVLAEAARGPASAWAPYVAALPARHPARLAAFGGQDAAALQHPAAAARAAAARAAVVAGHARARAVLADPGLGLPARLQTPGAWQWATATVASRGVFVPFAPAAGALCPIGDLHNYSPLPASGDAVMSPDGQFLVWTARRDYLPGEQVLMCYGAYTSLELLELYGFQLPPGANPHEAYAWLATELPCPPPAHPVLQQALDSALPGSAADRAARFTVAADGTPSWDLLLTVRAGVAATGAASPYRLQLMARALREGHPLDDESERRAWRWLLQGAEKSLQLAPTTLAADEAEHALTADVQDGSSLRLAAALEWRIGWKRGLVALVAKAQENLDP